MSDQEQLTVIKFTADGSGVESGLTSIKRSISDLGAAVKGITDKTNDALSKVGTKDLPVSDGLVRASKTIIKQTGDIEKAIATFGSTASTSLKAAYKDINSEEVRLRGLGINPDIMNPYLEKLREVQKITAAVSAQERLVSQEAAKLAAEENRRLEHTLELKRQLANVKTTVENNAAAKQAEAVAQQQFKLLDLNNKIAASNKAASDAQASAAAKTLKDLKDLTAAQAAYKAEVMNSQLNFTYTGRGKSTEFLADKGQRLGFDPSFIAAELAGYKKVEDAAKAAFQAANPHIAELSKRAEAAGTSVKGLSASLRNVPAQFTDIIVSLQGGQAPLTVLLQQGGQLKDLFGGVGNAARALGGYVLGLINPFTIAAAAVGTLALAYLKGAAEGEAYNKALIMTGNAAGVTAERLSGMAQRVAQATGGTIGSAAEALAGLAGTSGIASAQFEKIAAVAVRMEKVTGVAVSETVKQFAELGKDPLQASEKLNQSTHYLTAAVYEQIKALQDQGKVAEAGAVAQKAYATTLENRIPALVENLGLVESAWKGITSATKNAIDAVAGIGRTSTLDAQIAAIKFKLSDPNTRNNQWDGGKSLDKELETLQRMAASKGAMAAYDEARIKREEASIKLSQKTDEFASRQVKMQREIAQAQELYGNSNKTATDLANYEKSVVGISERYKESAKAVRAHKEALSEAEKGLALYNDLIDKGAGFTATWAEESNKLRAALDGGKISQEQFNAAVQIMYAKQPGVIAAEKVRADAIKEASKAYEDSSKAALKYYADLANNSDKLEASNQKQAEENSLLGLNEQAKASLTLARMDAAIATEQEAFSLLNLQNSSEIEIATAQRRIALMKEQRALSGQGYVAKEAAVAADAWKKAAENIRDSLTDAFIAAIDGTKSLWVSLRDSVVGMFKNMVLRPIVQGVMSSVVGGIASTVAGNAIGSSITSSIAGSAAGSALTSSTIASSVTAGVGAFWSGLTASGATASGAAAAGIAAQGAAAAGAGGSFAAGSSLSTTLAAIPVWGWGLMATAAVAAIASGRGETRMGASYVTGSDGKASLQMGPSGGEIAGDTAKSLFNATKTSIQDTLKLVGSSATVTGFVAGLESSKDGKGFAYAGGLINGQGFGDYKGRDGGQFGFQTMNAEQAMSAYVNELKKSTLEALQAATDIPKLLSDQLAGIDINALNQEGLDKLVGAISGTVNAVNGFVTQINTSGIKELHDLGFSAAAGLIAASGGLDQLNTNLSTYYSNFYTAEEQRLQTIANINKATAGSGLDAANATRESFRAIVEAQDLSTESGRAMYAALISVSGAFAGLTPVLDSVAATVATTVDALQVAMARAQNANAVADSAMAALTASIDAEKSALSQKYESDLAALTTAQDAYTQSVTDSISSISASVGALQSLSNRLKSSLANPLAGTDGQQRQSAQAMIASVLAIAKSGGGLPKDTSALESALSTVAKPSEKLFGSFEDYARDFYKTSNDISALSGITDTTLTAQQAMLAQLEAQSAISKAAYSSQAKLLKDQYDQTVKGLDTTLASAQKQLDALHGIDTSVLSVSAAIDRLAAALGAAKTTQTTSNAVTDDTIRGYIANLKTGSGTEADMVITLAKRAKEVGVTQADIARAMSMTEADVASYFASFGIPKFAVGTNYVPNDMIAQIHEGEAIIPKAYNPAANNGNGETAAALRALADRLDRIEANTRATAGHTAGTDRKLARVIPGNALITEAAV